MNERLQELYEQAYIETLGETDDGSPYLVREFDFEKFAELIVNRIIDNVECHAGLYASPDMEFICEKIVNSIKFDFGVEQ